MSPQPLRSVLLLTRALCSQDRAWGLIYHVCIPQHQRGLGTVTEARLTAETEPDSLDPSCLSNCAQRHQHWGDSGRFAKGGGGGGGGGGGNMSQQEGLIEEVSVRVKTS